jgi:hypothetical protein
MKSGLSRFVIIFIFSCITACRSTDEESKIVVVNINGADRNQLTSAINRLNSCRVKVIAINALLLEVHQNNVDTLLRNAVAIKKNVVLVSNLEDQTLIRSNNFFLDAAKDDGVLVFGADKHDVVNAYLPFVNVGTSVLWSFPLSVIGAYDLEMMQRLINEIHSGSYYKIDFDSKIEILPDLAAIQLNDFGRFENKIVLLGDLDYEPEIFKIPDGNDISGTLITAYILKNILEGKLDISGQAEYEAPKTRM